MTHIFELLEGGSISDCLFLPAFWLENLGVSSIAIEEHFKLLHRMSHIMSNCCFLQAKEHAWALLFILI